MEGRETVFGALLRSSSRTVDGDIAKTIDDSATPRPSLTAFTSGESSLALPTMFCEVTTTTMKERAGRCICTMKTLPALETTLHCCGPGRMRTLPRTKSSKGDVGGAAYWNTNSEPAMYIVLADNRYRALLSSRK